MKFKIKSVEIEVEWLLITLIFISIFSIKIRNYLMSYYSCYLFITFHELSHVIISNIFGVSLKKIKFSTMGLNVNFEQNILMCNMSNIKKVLIFFAGPLSNIIFAYIFNDIKMVFEINIFLALLNLIPIYPLDGYNILKLLSKNVVYRYIEKIITFLGILFIILGIIQIMLYKIPSILMFSMYIILINKKARIYT